MLTLRQAFVWSTERSLWARAVEVSPLAPGPHLALGRAYQHLHRFEDASREYLIALDLAGVSNETRQYRFAIGTNMAKLMAENHQADKAMVILDSLTEQYPESAGFLMNLKVILLLHSGMNCRMIRLLQLPCVNPS